MLYWRTPLVVRRCLAACATVLACLCFAAAPVAAQHDPTFSAPAGDSEESISAPLIQPRLLKQTFGQFDVVVFIDKSGSMNIPDCPDGRSRWGWCSDQTRQLMSSVDKVPDHRINIVLFNDSAEQHDDADLTAVGRMFESNKPIGDTKLAAPLADQIDQFMDRRWHTQTDKQRRLLVAVITDGGIKDMENLRQTIARTTARVNDGNTVRIVFIQVGNDNEGTAALRELDTGLRNRGSAYDIVDYVPFSVLQQSGLTQELVGLMLGAMDPGTIR